MTQIRRGYPHPSPELAAPTSVCETKVPLGFRKPDLRVVSRHAVAGQGSAVVSQRWDTQVRYDPHLLRRTLHFGDR